MATGNSPSIQPAFRFLKFQIPPELLNLTVKLNFVVFLKHMPLHIISQVYKCATCDDEIFAVKIVQMETQGTETKEVRPSMFSSKSI